MFRPNSWSHKGRFYVLFDIGAASIGVGLISCTKKRCDLIWRTRMEYGYEDTEDFTRYSRAMYATLLQAGMKVTSEAVRNVKESHPDFSMDNLEVICVLAPPWFKGIVHTVQQEREVPFQVTNTVLNKIRENMVTESMRSPESLAWQDVMGEPEVLNVHNDRVMLEGYPADSWLGHSTKEFTVHAYLELVAQSVQEHVEEILERVLPNHTIYYASSTRSFAQASTLGGKKNTKKRTTLIELGGQITSISILEGSVVEDTITIPKGTNHLMQAAAPNAVNAEEARGNITVLQKKVDSIELDTLPDELQTELADWFGEVMTAVHTISGGVIPPTRAVLVVGAFLYPLYAAALRRPWVIPNMKDNLDVEVAHLVGELTKDKRTLREIDTRLAILTRTVNDCSRKKPMCYTINNS